MHSIAARFQRIACRVLVPALLLWFGGICFMDCCTGGKAFSAGHYLEAAEQSGVAAAALEEGEAAHCNRASQMASAFGPANSCHKQFKGAMPCCSPAGQSADFARKSRIVPESRQSLRAENEVARVPQLNAPVQPSLSTTRIRNRSGTYLRDCVFLI